MTHVLLHLVRRARGSRRLLAFATALLAAAGTVTGSAAPAAAAPVRVPLLIITLTTPEKPALAHDGAYYEGWVAGGTPSLASYFEAQSQGRSTFTPAGRTAVHDDGADPGLGETAHDRGVRLAGRAGRDFARYDLDGDGTVRQRELTVLVVDTRSEGLGQARGVCLTPPAADGSPQAVRVCGMVAAAGHRSNFDNVAHEVAHTFDPMPHDLYGPIPDRRWCLSQDVTLMSCTASEGPGGLDERSRSVGLDPFTRRALGWVAPAAWSGARARSFTLRPSATTAAAPWGTTDLVEHRRPGGAERLLFEVRAGSAHDTALPGEGVYVWSALSRDGGTGIEPAWIPSLAAPDRPEVTDPGAFVLAPVGCRLDPSDAGSRGRAVPLRPGTYRLSWQDGRDAGVLLTVGATDGRKRVTITLRTAATAPSCPA